MDNINGLKPLTIYEDLANGVIFQTVEDYREALRYLDINPKHKESLKMKTDCEEFFQSKWFRFLTLVDGDWLMNKLKKEFEDEKEDRELGRSQCYRERAQ